MKFVYCNITMVNDGELTSNSNPQSIHDNCTINFLNISKRMSINAYKRGMSHLIVLLVNENKWIAHI